MPKHPVNVSMVLAIILYYIYKSHISSFPRIVLQKSAKARNQIKNETEGMENQINMKFCKIALKSPRHTYMHIPTYTHTHTPTMIDTETRPEEKRKENQSHHSKIPNKNPFPTSQAKSQKGTLNCFRNLLYSIPNRNWDHQTQMSKQYYPRVQEEEEEEERDTCLKYTQKVLNCYLYIYA